MWVFTLLFLSLYAGIWGKGDPKLCSVGVIDACEPKEPLPWEFPATAEDVDHLCPMVLHRLECLQTYIAECGDDPMLEKENFPKITVYVENLCTKQSKLREDVLEELPCIKTVVDNSEGRCRNITWQAVEVYEEHVRAKYKLEEDDYTIYNQQYQCFYSSFLTACFIADVDLKCGVGAKEVVIDAVQQVEHLQKYCPKDETEQLLELVQILELELEQKNLIKEIFTTKSDA